MFLTNSFLSQSNHKHFFYINLQKIRIQHQEDMISCKYIGANCNPMPNTLVFLDQKTICFCFRDQVGIYNLEENRITLNLNYRSAEINRANCLNRLDEHNIIVGYDSGHLIIFQRYKHDEWNIAQVIKQEAAITSIYFDQDTVITNNTNAEIIFYSLDYRPHEAEILAKQTLLKQFDKLRFPLQKTIQSFVQVTHNNIKILFFGGIDQKIHCYTRDSNEKPLVYRFELAGHENSITKLTIAKSQSDFLLASSSKDGYIRLWRVTPDSQVIKFYKNVKKLDQMYCFLDAVLISHESSVTNLKWVQYGQKLQLLSCSLDCTICLWSLESEQGAWTVNVRMGQFLGNKNAYFNITSDQNFNYLVAVNYIGSALIWAYNKENKKFTLRPSFNGHSNQVKDIDWDHSGSFLVSVSKDQTTRIVSKSNQDDYFHEISRAQVHGYDINAVSLLQVKQGLIDLIACGADEKVIRIVEPPACFANYLNYFTNKNLHLFFPTQDEEKRYIKSKPEAEILQYETYAQGGTQVLGLMTKVQRVQRQKISSYYDDEEQQGQEEQIKIDDQKEVKINYTIPPHDDYLVKHTLWPQMNKLYGHPHEISTLAKNNVRKVFASSCQGKNKIFCKIIIWSSEDWKIKKMIQHHSYTVYGMDFSPCGKFLASVGKDRRLAVFDENFQVIFDRQAHTRAILCVAFSQNSKLIATGSRDKLIKIWNMELKQKQAQYDIKKQIHSVAFCSKNIIATGCADGTILLLQLQNGVLNEIERVSDKYSPTKAITKLRWKNGWLGASSDDHSIRIYNVSVKSQQIQN